ncbi:MAG: prepilin-type N-terminal cleavage/methylation domain-containing protein [Fimbriimonadaceae bacterium]|nr:MAG: prepilin-type N-terminal cleavage/methylation domain-containing protein [Fimbriimonadaceae bacterium]
MKRRAFTLIELLVVIAIIAILAAILFPVFAQAKDAAKKTQSISNLKQTGTSVHIYIADYDDVLPQAAYRQSNVNNVIISVYDILQPYMKNKQILISPADGQGQSWKDRLTGLGLAVSTGGVERASYIPNLGLFGENLCGLAGKTAYTPVSNHAGLQEPVNTIMFFDGYIRKSFPDLNFYTFMAFARHADGVVINFADSHAKYYKWSSVNSIANDIPTPTGSRAPVYYSWRVDTANCGTSGLCNTEGKLQSVPIASTGYTANGTAGPYNDLHGIPGTNITDSEDTATCP